MDSVEDEMDVEEKAIERIRTGSEMSLGYYGKPLVCTYSGGKDSDVMLELFLRSGIPFEVHHSHTTADAPQTVQHIRKVFRDLELRGISCNIDYHARPEGGEGNYVEPDSQEVDAAHEAGAVLLLYFKRDWVCQSHDCHRGAVE